MSRQQIPEEVQTIAALIGESSQIDSMMMGRSPNLVTDTNTLKQGLNQFIQESRRAQGQPPQPAPIPQIPPVQVDNAPPPQMDIPPQPQMQLPPQPQPQTFLPSQEPVDEGQMEFNLEPTQLDVIIDLLKDISLKLKKQNSMLQDIYEKPKPKKERVPTTTCKSGKDK